MSATTHATVDVEQNALAQSNEARVSVRAASEKKVTAWQTALGALPVDLKTLQRYAAELRHASLDRLDEYLEQAEASLMRNGWKVHWAADAEQARQVIGEICQGVDAPVIGKSKSMVTEEIELNAHLEGLGYQPIETDLGEYVVQIEGDHPSHIVTPIIHINRFQVARAFEREGVGPYTDDPEELTMQARAKLRDVYHQAGVGITGGNFVCADTGRVITVTNEGNARFCANAPRAHIAVTGIDKILARESYLGVLLNLLSRSATGQQLTVYTQFLAGPRREGELDGPDERHIVLIDNGRSRLLGGEYHEMLRCIRCGACLNVCPVYRQSTGHAYGSVYPGPMGAIFSPLLGGEDSMKQYADLPKASSLCAACEEACPVAIPIPKMLLALRSTAHKEGLAKKKAQPPFAPWAWMSTQPLVWRAALKAGRTFGWGAASLAPVKAFQAWTNIRDLPDWPKQSFRSAWNERERSRKG